MLRSVIEYGLPLLFCTSVVIAVCTVAVKTFMIKTLHCWYEEYAVLQEGYLACSKHRVKNFFGRAFGGILISTVSVVEQKL